MFTRISDKVAQMFASDGGGPLYERVLDVVRTNDMKRMIENGVLVGFSGGPDSVMLLCFLYEYRRRLGTDFPIVAAHVNHMIRGDEADRDQTFAEQMCRALCVECISVRRDIPAAAKEDRVGIEEAARNARYSVFADIICGRNNICAIALAHNATDNMETVLINMMRGSGLVGMCGIPPVRDNIIRPLITLPKADILSVLDKFCIPYVLDSTNSSTDYTRNYVRAELLPLFKRLSPSPEDSVTRMTDNLRCDLSYIDLEVKRVYESMDDPRQFGCSVLRGLHPSIFAGVLSRIIKTVTGIRPEKKHIDAIYELIERDDFSISVCGEYDFVCQRGECLFVPKREQKRVECIYPLQIGENIVKGYNAMIYVGRDFDKYSSNIYKIFMKTTIRGDIIKDGLYMRMRQDGDAYTFDGMTHKLKKLFNDRKIPLYMRDSVPVICDSKGILWVPDLKVRDDAVPRQGEDALTVALCLSEKIEGDTELYYLRERTDKRPKTNKKGLEDT